MIIVSVNPASTSVFLLVDFITRGMAEEHRKKEDSENLEKEETFLIGSWINKLGLFQLDMDDNMSIHIMIHWYSQLLRCAAILHHVTHGNILVVTRFFMVKIDGVICVSWIIIMDGIKNKQEEKSEKNIYI